MKQIKPSTFNYFETDKIMDYLLLELDSSFGLDDIGWAHIWQRLSLPLKVTRSPGGKGRLENKRILIQGYLHVFTLFISFQLSPSFGANYYLAWAKNTALTKPDIWTVSKDSMHLCCEKSQCSMMLTDIWLWKRYQRSNSKSCFQAWDTGTFSLWRLVLFMITLNLTITWVILDILELENYLLIPLTRLRSKMKGLLRSDDFSKIMTGRPTAVWVKCCAPHPSKSVCHMCRISLSAVDTSIDTAQIL